jgi:hypothetical protein
LPIWTAASADSGGLCGTDTQATLSDAAMHIIIAQNIWLSWNYIHQGRLEKMHVQALLACEMMVCIICLLSSICFSALHLKFYMISNMISCNKQ